MRKGSKATEEQRQKFREGAKKRNFYGDRNPKWRGGKTIMRDGRVLIYAPDHPNANAIGGKYILEYRLLAEKKVGRHLYDHEVVHHINGDVTDNRLENLEITTQALHAGKHKAKLTIEQVKEIRRKPFQKITELSKRFKVSTHAVSDARHYISWRHI